MEIDSKSSFGRYFEEFSVGDVYRHWPGKTIFESDNNLFSLLTMNHHPIHLDTCYAKEQLHGKILVCGPLVISVVVGLSVSDISGKAIANLGYEAITHDAPVFIDDTIHAESRIVDKKESSSKPDRGTIVVATTAHNQNGKKVLTLRRRVLVPREENRT